MRIVLGLSLTAATGAIALLAGCAGNSPGSSSLVPNASAPFGTALGPRARVSPLGTCTTERRLRARMTHNQFAKPAKGLPYLYVVDACGPVVDVLNGKTYYELGSITNGLNAPRDAFVDRKGNLYVANFNGANVTEYAAGNWSAPSFTYDVNMVNPQEVTADANGNVYEADSANGFINEYYQGSNIAITSCQPGYFTYGVAVDGRNDVFAETTDDNNGQPELVEYPGGLNNCPSPTVLPLPSADVGGGFPVAVDKNANLLIPNGDDVEVVDASTSYGTVNASLGGFECASNVTLNKANTLAFVTDSCADTVTVVNYPTLTIANVLGSGNGLSEPYAAVAAPNAVY